MPIKEASPKSIIEAATLLQEGKLVAFPTETVYGLGADATNGEAVAKIFAAKGRPQFNPLIVHLADTDAAKELVEWNDLADEITAHFWPGPLTLILPRKKDCAACELCSAGLPTLAVRIPKHPVAKELLKAVGKPIAAPSANKSGALSPTTPAHVANSLGSNVDLILGAGACEIGLESTVLDLSANAPVVLRPGGITIENLESVLNIPVKMEIEAVDDSPRSPGLLLKHYAPSIPVRLNAIDLKPGEALLAFGSDKFMGIKGGSSAKDLSDNTYRNLSKKGDLYEAAANLFRMLHELDNHKHQAIAVMNIPEQGLGTAINDRLRRAASN